MKKTQADYDKERMMSIGRFYTKNESPSNNIHYSCLNCCVYVPDAFRLTGILWWLHSIGYRVQLNMMNLYQPSRLNPLLILTHGTASLSGSENLEEVREWVSSVKDDDYYKNMICCDDCVEAFKVLSEWEPDDGSTHMYIDKNRKGEEIIIYGNYFFKTENAIELTPEETVEYIIEHPSCIKI